MYIYIIAFNCRFDSINYYTLFLTFIKKTNKNEFLNNI